ncbi:Fur family transcriptional regulator [Dehalogenimonas etheniformans]|uniref:Transcriptional repressor n=1 Tax=Dehalogenimonas etheniformans TaxID=1536648 RepID=A0A2P5P6Z8_9CHLR|nr:Fur family transcriptional regulator [Dehalogenimonas etheniformans]PPD58072.1 transcriptional repressor [Dehalogenimonas etheniformans]QNT75277.1 transcriptional repressor [Dehalogenimonas etheniformans]
MTPLGRTELKATSQRSVILDIVRAGKGHLDADEIYQRARERLPRLSLSTVYRALAKFKETGLIEERHLDENHHHYEISHHDEHHHLICTGCGKVVEFKLPITEIIIEKVPQAAGFKINHSGELSLSGMCPDCQKKAT